MRENRLSARSRASAAVLTLLILTYSTFIAALVWIIVAKPFER